jgi:UDP-2,3-diacylglucosamine pyrophosphatase LpxH
MHSSLFDFLNRPTFFVMIWKIPIRGLRMLRQRVSRKFNRIYKKAIKAKNKIPIDFQTNRFVLFSDHHKGDVSPADDFKKNADLYIRALSYYKSEGYNLIVLGDNEELWENRYEQILLHYRKAIQLEIEMAPETPESKRIRIWGNHDKEVTLQRFKKRCQKWKDNVLANVEHREGLCLGEDIFLVHGHQGRFFEDQAWRLSRWAVHFIWKTVQKLLRIGVDGPAENFKIRDDLELNYYLWAKKYRVLLICGHTHRAIFGSMTHFDRLQIDLHRLEKAADRATEKEKKIIRQEINDKRAEIEKILSLRSGKKPKSFEHGENWPVPCYFNDGCCGYTNGMTCIEIDKNFMRLIKWQRQDNKRLILVENDIQKLLRYIKDSRPIDSDLEPDLCE